MRPIFALLLLACTSLASAQDRSQYSLNDGKLHFDVPADWVAIMQKTEGNPQAIAFQAPNPGAADSGAAADVTVKSRQVRSPADFAATVASERERAQAQPGYSRDGDAGDDRMHRYFVQNGSVRYLVQDRFQLSGTLVVEVRCRRPILAATPASWNRGFDAACDAVFASLGK